MSVVNTEGLTLFGAGSEWFWVMLQFVIVAITLVGIYAQLRVARNANAFEQASALKQEWDGERLMRRRLAIFTAIRDGGPDVDLSAIAPPIGNFFDHVGGLVRAGHIELAVVYEYMGTACDLWWTILGSEVRRVQAEQSPAVYENFVWLADEVRKLEAAHGLGPYDLQRFLVLLPGWITAVQTSISEFEAMRTVIVAAPPTGTVAVATVAEPRGEGSN